MSEDRSAERESETTDPEPASSVQVFTAEVLEQLRERDEPRTASRAELAGPWQVVAHPAGGFAVTRAGDHEAGAPPYGRFADRHHALLVGAATHALLDGSRFHIDPERSAEGYRLLREGTDVGSFLHFEGDIQPSLDALESVLRFPQALAWLLEAAGPTALELAGRQLGLHLLTLDDGAD